MNKYLAEEIFDIVKRLDQAELKSFKSFSQKKKPHDGKEHKYMELFKLYLKQKDALEFEEAVIIKGSKQLTASIHDLNQKLHEELLKFLAHDHREKSTDELEGKISELLDTSIALYEKRLYRLSAKSFSQVIRLLQSVEDLNFKENLLYLAIKAYSRVLSIRYNGKLSGEELKEFDAFYDYVRPFAQLARNTYNVFSQTGYEESLDNGHFNNATFYALLNIYFREHQEFEALYHGRGNDPLFSFSHLLNDSSGKYDTPDRNAEQAKEAIIDTASYFFQLERLHRSIAVNDSTEFNQAFSSITNKLFMAFSPAGFNADLLLFMYRQLFELRTLYTLQDNQQPLDTYDLREIEMLSRSKMHFFHESEMEDFALRVELNSLIILFLESRYKELLKRLLQFEKEIKGQVDKPYYIDARLLIILCKMETGGSADEDLENRITYYENYFKHYPDRASLFHKKFKGFLHAYLKEAYHDQKKVCTRYLAKLEASKETFNHFHAVFLHWLKRKADPLS